MAFVKDVITPVPRVLLSATLAGPAPSGSTGHVPALSGLLPPSPAPPRSGCPQLHRPAATRRRRRSLTSTRTTAPRCAGWRSLAPQLLIRRYLHRVQRRPDRFAAWDDHLPLVRTRPPGGEVVRPGGSHVGSQRPPSFTPWGRCRYPQEVAGWAWEPDLALTRIWALTECVRISDEPLATVLGVCGEPTGGTWFWTW